MGTDSQRRPNDRAAVPAVPAQAGATLQEILPQVYDQLRSLAERYLQDERPGHTLQATALVHEAYLRLAEQRDAHWQNDAHVVAIAAQAMRRILVDHARGRARIKRGGDRLRITLSEAARDLTDREVDLLALDEALQKLAEFDERKATVVELRYFAGLTVSETASVVGKSERVIADDLAVARAWLRREMSRGLEP